MMKKVLRISSFFMTTSFFLILFLGCEDDPLLAPQTDAEPDGGSYGLLFLNEGEDLNRQEMNPEIF